MPVERAALRIVTVTYQDEVTSLTLPRKRR